MPPVRLMQTQGFSDERLDEKMAQTFGDLDSVRILHAVSTTPRTAQGVSDITGIPLSSVYRKLAGLRNAGLVYLKSSEITRGKKRDLFASAVDEIRVVMDEDRIVLDLVPTEEYAKRTRSEVFTYSSPSPRFSGTWSMAVNGGTSHDKLE